MLSEDIIPAVIHLSFMSFTGEVTVRIRFQLLPECSILQRRLESIPIRGERKNKPKNRDCCVQRASQVNLSTSRFALKLIVPITAEITGISINESQIGLRLSLINSAGRLL